MHAMAINKDSFLNDVQAQCLKLLVQTTIDVKKGTEDNFLQVQETLQAFSTQKDKFEIEMQNTCTAGIIWNGTIQFFTQL